MPPDTHLTSRFQRSLASDEEVLWCGAPDRQYLHGQLVRSVVGGLALVALFIVLVVFLRGSSWRLIPLGALMLASPFLLEIAGHFLWQCGYVIYHRDSAYLLSSQRLLVSHSPADIQDVPLGHIAHVSAHNGKTGDVRLVLKSGYYRKILRLRALSNPLDIKADIDAACSAHRTD